jgi:uncharacterized protein YyaL (SSP411 family)
MFKPFARLCVVLASLSGFSPLLLSAQEVPVSQSLDNQLVDNPSPYLALHGSDPVAWQAWDEEAIVRSKAENKPLFISSGYFSCHWCHVMQAESYKNAEIAKILNAYFIPIKIDRELESALDQRLMDYAQATLKQGGWPLNVFLSPDGLPLYAVLYQPKEQFQNILVKLAQAWVGNSAKIRDLALKERVPVTFPDAKPELDAPNVQNLVDATINHILSRADDFQGGFGSSNKFPSTPQLFFLLEQQQVFKSKRVDAFLRLTLDVMASGGMMDQLSGGFYRYSVDPAWDIPHFEKMLYDNANLARVYLHAGQILNEPRYTAIATRTLDFMIDNMAGDHGALVAAFSAVDNESIEGGYYLWTQKELGSLLNTQQLSVFNTAWNMDRRNELEKGNHLRNFKPIDQIAEVTGLTEEQVQTHLNAAHLTLLTAREQRILPVDDKFLTAWNGLALTVFAEAGQLLDNNTYQEQAAHIKTFILSELWDGKQLTRGLAKGQAVGSAAIEDYAYLAQGLLAYAQGTQQQEDYLLVDDILQQAWSRFYQNNAWSRADGALLPAVDGEELMQEGASASPAAVILQTSIALAAKQSRFSSKYQSKILSALNRGHNELTQAPFWFATQVSAMHKAITNL